MRGRRRTLALAVILVAGFMDLLDVTVLNVALPSIEDDLGASTGQAQWVLSGYTLTFALVMISGARLGDRWGRRRTFCVGVGGFIAASACCGLAGSAEAVIAGRVVQGLFAALMVPQILVQVQVLYGPGERGGPIAAFSAMTGLASTVGPVLGAVLTEASLPEAVSGWRLIFWINVPVGVAALAAARVLLPESHGPQQGIDLLGSALAASGLVLLLAPLTLGAGAGPPGWAPVAMILGLAVLAGFIAHQRRRAATGRPVVLEVGLFRLRSLRSGLLTQTLFFVPIMGFFLIIMQFLQHGMDRTPLEAGLIMLPWSVTVAVAATLAATVLLPRLGRVTIQIGLAALAAGFGLLAAVGYTAGPATSWWVLLPGLLVGAAGMGLVVAPLAELTLAEVRTDDASSASALFNTNAQLSASIGVTALGAVFFAVAPSSLAASSSTPPSGHLGTALVAGLALGVVVLAGAFAASWSLPGHRPTPIPGHAPPSPQGAPQP